MIGDEVAFPTCSNCDVAASFHKESRTCVLGSECDV